jgi:phosphotransferase system enzyme I (PtsI)
MAELRGTGIGRGVAAGRVVRLPDPEQLPPAAQPGPVHVERELAIHALAQVASDLRALARPGTDAAAILEAQALMATDPALVDEVLSTVERGLGARQAIISALSAYAQALSEAGGYLAARVADLEDIGRRAAAVCAGVCLPPLPRPGHPYVLVARDLAPADVAVLDDQVLALITIEGGPTSHSAILARSMGIPAVIGCADAVTLHDEQMVTVDAARGLVLHGEHVGTQANHARSSGPGRTADGHRVLLQANIGSPEDIAAALEVGAEGVGLMRTEFCDSYTEVFQAFSGYRVTVRVFDAGSDKPLPGLSNAGEPNPALGVRGVRALRANPEILDAQLGAIAAAATSAGAQVWVMAPMVAHQDEAAWFAERATAHGLPVAGVMIEVPSAALTAHHVLSHVNFASIGTNDLTQFTLAADRQVGALAHLQDPWHPAVLRLIAEVCRAGEALGRPVGVCGEAAADPRLACVLVGLGVTSLSMAPGAIAEVREELMQHTLDQCREMARSTLE